MTDLLMFDWDLILQNRWFFHSFNTFVVPIIWTVPSAEDTNMNRQPWTCSQGAYVLEEGDRPQTVNHINSEGNKAVECDREKVRVVRVVERGLDFMEITG